MVTDNGLGTLFDDEEIAVTVNKRPTMLTYSGDSTRQYSDTTVVKATLTDNGAGVLQGAAIPGATVVGSPARPLEGRT